MPISGPVAAALKLCRIYFQADSLFRGCYWTTACYLLGGGGNFHTERARWKLGHPRHGRSVPMIVSIIMKNKFGFERNFPVRPVGPKQPVFRSSTGTLSVFSTRWALFRKIPDVVSTLFITFVHFCAPLSRAPARAAFW